MDDEEEAILDEARFAESEEEVIGVCWYCGARLRGGYDYDVVCREMPGRGGVEATGRGPISAGALAQYLGYHSEQLLYMLCSLKLKQPRDYPGSKPAY